MNNWHKIFLGNAADAFAETHQIQKTVMAAYMADGGNIEMALFSELDDHGNITLYFSPALARIARAILGAVSCPCPAAVRLQLLGPDQRCEQILPREPSP